MHAKYINGKISIFESYIHKESIKGIQGHVWDAENKTWTIPFNKHNLMLLQMMGCKLDEVLLKEAKEIKLSNGIRNKPAIAIASMPIKATPYSHQIEAYNKACSEMGIFNVGDAHG